MGKRAKKQSCPNPQFLTFLQEWRDEAREKGRTNLQHAYHKAFSSIQKYPMPLRNGQEAMILEGIGPNIAKKLDEALVSYQENGEQDKGIEVYEAHSVQSEVSGNNDCRKNKEMRLIHRLGTLNPNGLASETSKEKICPSQETGRVKSNQTKKPTEYTPGYRTGAYALLLTLYEYYQRPDNPGFMSKDELQKKAQSLSDKSFTLPDPGSRYTSWSSMSTLIKKGLVLKACNPAKYSLTPDGCKMAEKLTAASATDGPISCNSQAAVPFIISASHDPCSAQNKESARRSDCVYDDHIDWISGKRQSNASKEPRTTAGCGDVSSVGEQEIPSCNKRNEAEFTPEFILKPGSFDIVLCVDFIETTGGSSNSRKDAFVKELKTNGVHFDIRKLQVGDFLWIAREKSHHLSGDSEPKELVLDYIVERKRMDDLNSSIIDGRFREQKFRLRNCGLRHPIYLVENFGSGQHLSLPEATLKQAIVNTQVIDGFFVKRTQDTKESAAYLTLMTRFIHKFYSEKTLYACPRAQNLSSASYLIDSKTTSLHLMTFQEFSKETSKNKVVTVSEMFGKQLMQISGMSAEKAASVLGSYPTPKRLLEAYDRHPTIQQKETMLAYLKFGKQQRNIGPSLSKLIYQLYSTRKTS